MKVTLHRFILTFAVITMMIVISAINSYGQESESVQREYRVKSGYSEEPSIDVHSNDADEEVLGKDVHSSLNYKDSIVSSAAKSNQAVHRHQRVKPTGETQKQSESQKQVDKKEEKDSILSFNFIYYIFKKFKWSDIAE